MGVMVDKMNDRKSKLKTLDLFCGAGGLSLGFEMAGYEVLAGVDNEESFLKTFEKSHENATPIKKDLHDNGIKDVIENEQIDLNDIDVVIGGPPCQGFSTAGNRMIEDPRNELVKEYTNSIREIKPKVFLMENVTGLSSMENGVGELVTDELVDIFEEIGYKTKYKILNSVNFGVPQKRKRLFFVGIKDEINIDFRWPEPSYFSPNSLSAFKDSSKTHLTVRDAISDLPKLKAGGEINNYKKEPENSYQRWARKKSTRLLNHHAPNHGKTVLERIKNIPPGGNHSDLPEELQLNSGYPNIYGKLEWDSPSDTITGNFGCASAPGRFLHPRDNRVLSVREGARLQSFPDHIEIFGNKSEMYKQIGNAVPVVMATKLGIAIKNQIDEVKV